MATAPQGIGAGIAARQAPQPAPGAVLSPDTGQVGGGASEVSPEEQGQYDKFVNKALDIMYPADTQGQMSPALAAQLQGEFGEGSIQLLGSIDPPLDPSNPQDCIAATAVLLCLYLDASASQAGVEISDDVMFNGGSEIVEILASDGEEAGFFQVDDKQTEQAFYRACDIFRTVSPRVDQDALAAQFEEVVNADRQGQLKQLLPTLPTEA